MYLSRSLQWNENTCDMVGALPLDTQMHTRPQGRGYVQLAKTSNNLWGTPTNENEHINAHEFHYSSAENLEKNTQFAYRVLRGHGVDGSHDGIIYRNVMANYSHMRHVESNPWVTLFIDFVRQQK
jgi:cobyrinic acid a,c-diamide synthase